MCIIYVVFVFIAEKTVGVVEPVDDAVPSTSAAAAAAFSLFQSPLWRPIEIDEQAPPHSTGDAEMTMTITEVVEPSSLTTTTTATCEGLTHLGGEIEVMTTKNGGFYEDITPPPDLDDIIADVFPDAFAD